MAMKKHESKCDCIFCNSKCPGCGSEAIDVEFNVQFKYKNNSTDWISVNRIQDSIILECAGCGREFDSEFEHDAELNPLRQALSRGLVLPGETTFDCNDGKIEVTQYEPYVAKKADDAAQET